MHKRPTPEKDQDDEIVQSSGKLEIRIRKILVSAVQSRPSAHLHKIEPTDIISLYIVGSIFMRKEKAQAIKLRKQGLSYNEIGEKLKISKSTLSCWLSKIKLSQKAKDRLSARVYAGSITGLIKRNKNQTTLAQERARKIRIEAKRESFNLLQDPLFLTGISLYWAEGYKKGAIGSKWKSIDFANSDPEMIKIIMKFFRKFLKIDNSKIKIQLMAHRNVDIDKAVDFWSKLTKVPTKQFIKTYATASKSSNNKRKSNSLTFGTVHIRINDVKLFFRIIGWIDGLKSKI